MAGPFATKAEIISIASKLKPDITVDDIPDIFFNATSQIIELKTGRSWDIVTDDQYIDGRNEYHIHCPITPIVTLDSVVIIETNTEENIIDCDGADRQLWYNQETGLIKIIDHTWDITRDGVMIFPEGVKNIRIEGSFGIDKEDIPILKMLQCLLIMQQLGFIYPSQMKATDLTSEKIGEYSYSLNPMEYTKDPKNQNKTIEGYINDLFNILKQRYDDGFVEAI